MGLTNLNPYAIIHIENKKGAKLMSEQDLLILEEIEDMMDVLLGEIEP